MEKGAESLFKNKTKLENFPNLRKDLSTELIRLPFKKKKI